MHSIGILELVRLNIERGFESMEYVLEKGEVVSFVASAGSQVLHVGDGSIWLTRAEDARDYIITPSSRFLVNYTESIVIEALENASFSLVAVDSLAPARLIIQLYAAIPHKA